MLQAYDTFKVVNSALLSVPFSSGQGMLLLRFWVVRLTCFVLSVPFSSGQGMLHLDIFLPHILQQLSVPFSSGQGMLRELGPAYLYCLISFSPLFIGSRNVTVDTAGDDKLRLQTFSPLFIGSRNVTTYVDNTYIFV